MAKRRSGELCQPNPTKKLCPKNHNYQSHKLIHAAEAHVSELETTLAAPDFYATRAKDAPALLKELEAAKTEVTRLYARWEELDKIGK